MTFDFSQRKKICEITSEDLEKEVFLSGFVHSSRDHGNLLFIDLRDESDLIQIVIHPEIEALAKAKHLHIESTVGVRGVLKKRPEGTENPKLRTGRWEVQAQELFLFAQAQPLPFTLDEAQVDEKVRLRYRYLDLRRPEMQEIFRFRSRFYHETRSFFHERHFVELDTPHLIRSTPEGARDFLVPSRFFPGKFYALPQSPQLFKQIFMISGFEKYFQIVRCFRDEDLRLDRQPEFTQLDVEMAYCNEAMVKKCIEELIQHLFSKLLHYTVPLPFPALSYQKSLELYGTDKPDLRSACPIKDVTHLFTRTAFKVFQQVRAKGGVIKGITVSGKGDVSRHFLDNLTKKAVSLGAKGLTWFVWKDSQLASPVAKFLTKEEQESLPEAMGAQAQDLLLVVADEPKVVHHVLSSLNAFLAKEFPEKKEEFAFLWVEDFPLFEFSPLEKRLVSVNHPFTAPREEDLPLLEKEPEKVKARAYDLVLNGVEIGGGSIRIHDRELQRKIFQILGLDEKEQEAHFGFFLQALSFGVPPHGGVALGLDRLLMIMLKQPSIREVIPFPKTQTGSCLFSEAPFEVSPEQLSELHLKVKEQK